MKIIALGSENNVLWWLRIKSTFQGTRIQGNIAIVWQIDGISTSEKKFGEIGKCWEIDVYYQAVIINITAYNELRNILIIE